MKILLYTFLSLVGIVGGAFIASTVNQPNSKAQKLEVVTQQPTTQSQQGTNSITTTQQINTQQVTPQTQQTNPQPSQKPVQQAPTGSQQTLSPAESYRQSTNSCPGRPLRIRSFADYDLTAESNVGMVKPCDVVLVGSNRISVNSFGCNGSEPLEFVKVTVPPETEVLDPTKDDEQPNNVAPQREGYVAICGLDLRR